MSAYSKSPFRPAQPPSEDPVAWLFDCHARIGRVAAGLRALADAGPNEPRAPMTARACERYLRLALSLHASDEDQSIAPRLITGPGGIEIDRALERMNSEHTRILAGIPSALEILTGVATGAPPPEAALDELATWFEGLVLPHLRLEERIIFPAMARLPRPVLAQIATEMRARRAGPATPESP